MKNIIFLIVLTCFVFVSCNNAPTETEKEPTVTVSENANWEKFWNNFQLSLTKNDIGGLINLTKLPLVSNALSDKNAEGLSKMGLIKAFPNIFDGEVKERILAAKSEEWKTTKVADDSQAKLYGVPVGTEVKSLQLNFVSKEEEGSVDESSRIFSFALIGKEYRWCALILAG